AQPLAGVGVEILMEEDEIPVVRILGVARIPAVTRATSRGIGKKQTAQAPSQFARDLFQREIDSGTGGTLHLELVSIIVMVPFERFDEEVVRRKPDRPAPIGVAAEQAGVGFARHITHAVYLAAGLEFIRVLLMELGQGTNPIGGQELVFIKEIRQYTLEM